MGFTLHKRAFRDAVFLRYGWTPPFLPNNCICGKAFSVEHALSCNRGAFPIHRHNEIHDLTAELLTQVCHNVCLKPSLQKLNNEHFQLQTAITDDNARLDISADGFWERSERVFFDVFNPFPSTNLKHQLGSCYHLLRLKRGDSMMNEFGKSNEEALHLWSSQHLEAWASKQQFFFFLQTPCLPARIEEGLAT